MKSAKTPYIQGVMLAFLRSFLALPFLAMAMKGRGDVYKRQALIPPAVLAGVLALLLGPKSPWEVCRILPLSSSFGTYASVLIVLVFAATPIGDRPKKGAMSGSKILGMFFNISGLRCV